MTNPVLQDKYPAPSLSLIVLCESRCDIADAAAGTMGSGYRNPGGEGRGYVERFGAVIEVDCSDELGAGELGVATSCGEVVVGSGSDGGVRMEPRCMI